MQQRARTRRTAGAGIGWTAAALVALGVLVASLLVLVVSPRWMSGWAPGWVPGADACTVGRGGQRIGLSTGEAQRAARLGAAAVRQRSRRGVLRAALEKEVGIEPAAARQVAAAVTGRSPHALSCRHGGAAEPESDRLDGAGLTERAAQARRDLERAFGPQRMGGFAQGGVSSGHMPGSAHYDGRALDVFFRPVDQRNRKNGWALAHYCVAHAERLGIETVIFDARIWTARRGWQGWRDYAPGATGGPRRAAVLEHRDHVHVDVAD